MKEFIDFSDNFKPEGPEGKVKVELFDDLTGRKIEEIETNNFIAKGMDYLYHLAMISAFTDDRYTGGFNAYDAFNDPFQYMILTDASHPEDPKNEWLVKGRTIGFAFTTPYSGGDIYQGSYNAVESFTNREQVHIVIDFPTHAANGTFQSIYFLSYHNVFNENDVFDKPFGEIRSIQKYNGYFYVLGYGGNYFMRYDGNFNKLDEWELKYRGSEYNRDFVIYDGNIYFANYDTYYIARGIRKVPLSKPDSEDIEPVYDDELCYGITHDGRYFYVSNYTYDTIMQFDNNFNIVEIYEPKIYNGDVISGQLHVDTDGTIILNRDIWNQTYVWDRGNNLTYTGGIDLKGFIDDDKIIGNYDQLVPKKGISSRVLLDSPVTKTSNNTMKITYDFMLPSFM